MGATIIPKNDLPILFFEKSRDWEDWLNEQYDRSPGVWLQLAKKSSGLQSITYDDAVEVALCYGWIDGQKKGFDEFTWLQKFTPRGDNSIWSKINRDKAQALIDSGRIKSAGLHAVERAKQNGRWEAAYDSHSTASVPDDFQNALDDNPEAKAFFATLNSQNRFAILFRIQTAKKAETRTRRIQKYVQMLERHEKIYP